MSIQVFVLLSAIAVRTAIVFATLIAAIRLTGRRQFGEIDTKDIVVVLMVSNAVQNSMTLGVGRLSAALVSAATIIFLTKAFGLVVRLRPDWQRHAMGTPTVLVYKGRPIKKNMLREKITENELIAAIRKARLEDVKGVRLAVLETDGSISVIGGS